MGASMHQDFGSVPTPRQSQEPGQNRAPGTTTWKHMCRAPGGGEQQDLRNYFLDGKICQVVQRLKRSQGVPRMAESW